MSTPFPSSETCEFDVTSGDEAKFFDVGDFGEEVLQSHLRRSTERRTHHRHAALCLATAILITMKLNHLARPLPHDLTAYPLKSLCDSGIGH